MLVHGWPFLQRDDGFWRWRSVSERAVRALGVVVFAPLLDDNLGFPQRIEYLSIYDALKALSLDQPLREKLGREGREYALNWFSMDACAERFEEVYDRLQSGETPKSIKMQMFPSYRLE